MNPSQLIQAAGVVAALSGVRRYYFEQDGFSAWCLMGGLVSLQAGVILANTPAALRSLIESVPMVQAQDVLVMAASAISLEMAFDGAIQFAELSQMSYWTRIAIGAAAGYVGSMAGRQVAAMIY